MITAQGRLEKYDYIAYMCHGRLWVAFNDAVRYASYLVMYLDTHLRSHSHNLV